jgi:death-on-curing protein
VSIDFLEIGDVPEIHGRELDRFGGLSGLRDRSLLESALSQPMAMFDGVFLHTDVHAMAAAYWYHIVRKHPFLDGNKRTGLIVALTFLAINGITIPEASHRLYDATMAAAEGRVTKEDLADLLRQLLGESG